MGEQIKCFGGMKSVEIEILVIHMKNLLEWKISVILEKLILRLKMIKIVVNRSLGD